MRRLTEPYGTLSLSKPEGMALGVRLVGVNSDVDFVYELYLVLEGLEVGVEGHCSVAVGVEV